MIVISVAESVVYRPKDRIVVSFEGTPYIGTITQIRAKKLNIKFDDGESETIPQNSRRLLGKGIKKKTRGTHEIRVSELDKWVIEPTPAGVIMIKKHVRSAPVIKIDPLLKRDPVKYGHSLTIKDLVKMLKDADQSYHNDKKGVITLTDVQYDSLVEVLQTRAPKNPFLKTVGAPVDDTSTEKVTKKKVRLPFPMASLNKIKSDTADQWLEAHPGPYVLMDKQDGLSMAVTNKDDTIGLYTRGDGMTGLDVSHLAPYLRIPKIPAAMEIRAEIQMSKARFEKYAKDFANPRNAVGGTVTRLTVNTAMVKDSTLIAYEIVRPRMKKSAQLKKLKALGFRVPAHKVVKTLDAVQLEEINASRRKSAAFEMDGIVIEQDKVNKLVPGNPKYAAAFKSTGADAIATVKVLNVHWEESKHGYLKPRIEIPRTLLSGVHVQFATGFNAKYINDNGIGRGAVIKITRSGDVIPHVISVEKKVKPKMPTGEWEWNKTGVDAISTGEVSETVQTKQINSFFRTMKVEDFSIGLVTKLFDDGLDTIQKILKATQSRLLKIDGIQERMAQKIHGNIRKFLTDVELPRLMDASGVFGRGLGTTRMEVLVEMYPDIADRKLTKNQAYDLAMDAPGFSAIMAQQFADGFKPFQAFLQSLPSYVTIAEYEEQVVTSTKLSGQNVVFTGFRDAELKEAILENGGVVGSGVSSKTTILLLADPSSTSGKAQKARDLGVRLMTPEDFRGKFKL